MEKSSHALVVGELSLFMRLFISLATRGDPLVWWWIHEIQFPNVSLFVKQILGIPRSHIEIEHVFNLVGVLTSLRCYRLQVDNLNQIITVVNNWLDDPHLNCSRHKDLTTFCKLNLY
jgi:hypothetical protein